MMSRTANIRNIVLVGAVDHGCSTLLDVLLADARLVVDAEEADKNPLLVGGDSCPVTLCFSPAGSMLAGLSAIDKAALHALSVASERPDCYLCPRARLNGLPVSNADVVNVIRSFLSGGRLLYGLPADFWSSGDFLVNILRMRALTYDDCERIDVPRMADGAVIVVDCVEGCMVSSEQAIFRLVLCRG